MKTRADLMNPFPGLRSFRSDEDYLFFGRDEQTLELMARLERKPTMRRAITVFTIVGISRADSTPWR